MRNPKGHIITNFTKTGNLVHSRSFIFVGNITASDVRVLCTKWLADAWKDICTRPQVIISAFKRYGIFNAIDHSEDQEISDHWLRRRDCASKLSIDELAAFV